VLQIAAVIALIAVNPAPLWVDLLVYAAVAVTLISGAHYFLGLRRLFEEEDAEAMGPAPREPRRVSEVERSPAPTAAERI
jgi:CDP-diacylglycerol--glycerol-3-phosphate 3-phosphatidyltransferase